MLSPASALGPNIGSSAFFGKPTSRAFRIYAACVTCVEATRVIHISNNSFEDKELLRGHKGILMGVGVMKKKFFVTNDTAN
jgi:hypothetical protein